jgi:hypothetical protein
MRRRVPKSSNPASPALRRLGLASPPAFFGRTRELAALEAALADAVLLILTGASGAGKSRLVAELCRRPAIRELDPVVVRCRPGDLGDALWARAERDLGALPGSLEEVLANEPRLLIIDDAHHLVDAPEALRDFAAGPGAGRVLLTTSERLPVRRPRAQRFELTLDGLDEAAARELWSHLEETYGPTAASACDQALNITGGVPLALRREYARASSGAEAWSPAALAEGPRVALEAVAVLDLPVAPPALARIVESLGVELDLESALVELLTRQLIAPLADGRFHAHDLVRGIVLAAMGGRRAAVEAVAAEQIALESERGSGDFGALDPVDRLRETARHWLAAGEAHRAAALLARGFDDAAMRGAAGEVIALARRIEAAEPQLAGELRTVRARASRRRGAVALALELGGTGDPVDDGWLRFLGGEVEAAKRELEAIATDAADAARSGLASARLARIEVEAGALEAAAARIARTFDRGGDGLDGTARAELHLAAAALAAARGDGSAARASLARARGAGDIGAELTASIDLVRAELLGQGGRGAESAELLERAAAMVIQLDFGALADEVVRLRALLAARAGDLAGASDRLRRLIAGHRERGNEIPALRAELDLAELLLRRGELSAAAELAAAAHWAASGCGLGAAADRARMIVAEIDLAVMRLAPVREAAEACAGSPVAAIRQRASRAARLVAAMSGEPLPELESSGDEIADVAHAIAIAVARRDTAGAIKLAREQAATAERSGRTAEMVEALAVLARLRLARGDRPGATATASRAAREALGCGMTAARADALLVLAALARDNSDPIAAQAYARDAAEMAAAAGLPLRRLAASRAMELIADGDTGPSSGEREAAAAAAMSEIAVDATAQVLADLGLTSARPYRVVTGAGAGSFVADASPSVLRMEERDLVIDAVREVIVRGGVEIADLRRRSLLKRLLFLFARSPGLVFSKEDIVQKVWEVEYHPLRHDAALFTNIMRIRRLLGDDGADLIRVSDEGYRFCPEKDFLYVEHAPEA